MKFSSPALVVFSLLCSRFGHVSSADVEVDPLGRVRNLGASKSAKATSSPTGSPTASPTASPTKGPIGSPTDPPSALLEESFLEGRTADVDATASVAKNDDGPELIVGGTDATRGAYPYYVYIGEDTNGVCGGSLIAPRTVLTAAHCNVDANGDFTRDDVYVGREVRIGALAFPPRFPDADDGSVTATVIRQIIHPDYVDIVTETGSNLVNDFMLFYLDEEVEVDNPNNIQLRLRDDEGDIEPGTVLTAVGLGDSTVGDPAVFPDTLQELNNLIALPDNFCETLRPDVAMCAAAPVKTNVVDGDQNICGVSQ